MEDNDEATMACPRCGTSMVARTLSRVGVLQCPAGHGVFLERASLGELADAETEFHRGSGHQTQPLPRITADMTAPPPAAVRAGSFVETLFG